MKDVIKKARELALDEIKEFGTPPVALFEVSLEQGQVLAEACGADKDIVTLGTILMDVKLGEAKSLGKKDEHIKMSADASEVFLKDLDVDDGVIHQVLQCVNEHHGTKKFGSIEAEICANADCYRFLRPDILMVFITGLTDGGMELNDAVKFVLKKMEEKHKTLSLPKAIKDLRTHYATMKEFLENGVLKNENAQYYKWTTYKQIINKKTSKIVYFNERELWWMHIGLNVGHEQNGHGDKFLRPVLILKRINRHLFVGIPQTSKDKIDHEYYYKYKHNTRQLILLLLQIRVFSSARLHEKLGMLNKEDFIKVKERVKKWL